MLQSDRVALEQIPDRLATRPPARPRPTSFWFYLSVVLFTLRGGRTPLDLSTNYNLLI